MAVKKEEKERGSGEVEIWTYIWSEPTNKRHPEGKKTSWRWGQRRKTRSLDTPFHYRWPPWYSWRRRRRRRTLLLSSLPVVHWFIFLSVDVTKDSTWIWSWGGAVCLLPCTCLNYVDKQRRCEESDLRANQTKVEVKLSQSVCVCARVFVGAGL